MGRRPTGATARRSQRIPGRCAGCGPTAGAGHRAGRVVRAGVTHGTPTGRARFYGGDPDVGEPATARRFGAGHLARSAAAAEPRERPDPPRMAAPPKLSPGPAPDRVRGAEGARRRRVAQAPGRTAGERGGGRLWRRRDDRVPCGGGGHFHRRCAGQRLFHGTGTDLDRAALPQYLVVARPVWRRRTGDAHRPARLGH